MNSGGTRDQPPAFLLEMMLLAALWGASFLFMRWGAADFGAVALAFVRVAGAALCLLPLLALRGEWPALRSHWRPVMAVGLTNSALPFLGFSIAALALPAGLSSIFNATTPLWGALIAWAWLDERPGRWRAAGLALGLAGVVGLSLQKSLSLPAAHGVGPGWAMAACVGAAMLYGYSGHYTRQRLTGVPPMAVAAGSQVSATLALALPAWALWPARTPPPGAWAAAAALAVLCTALAYLMYFRLIGRIGASRTLTVTFLIPAFALVWGFLFLGEAVTPAMAVGGAVIVAGTVLATGLWPRPRPRPQSQP